MRLLLGKIIFSAASKFPQAGLYLYDNKVGFPKRSPRPTGEGDGGRLRKEQGTDSREQLRGKVPAAHGSQLTDGGKPASRGIYDGLISARRRKGGRGMSSYFPKYVSQPHPLGRGLGKRAKKA